MTNAAARLRLSHPRGALCAVCRRPTRGFGWFDPVRSKRPRPSAWFCSKGCQGFWVRLARERPTMVDLTPQEEAAIRAAVKPMAELMEEIGWETPLAGLTEAQVCALIEAAVEAFQDAMRAQTNTDSTEIPF